jgi:hypothetical protein
MDRVEIDVGDERELRSLRKWLVDEPGLRGWRITLANPELAPGDMGAISDVLVVALGSGGAGAALVASLSAWLQTRVTTVKMRMRSDAGEVEIEATTARDPAALVERLAKALPRADDTT